MSGSEPRLLSHETPTIEVALSDGDPFAADLDALVIGMSSDGSLSVPDSHSSVMRRLHAGRTQELAGRMGARGDLGQVLILPSGSSELSPLMVVVGLGGDDSLTRPLDRGNQATAQLERLRVAAGSALAALVGHPRVGFLLPLSRPEHAGAVVEGVIMGAYRVPARGHAAQARVDKARVEGACVATMYLAGDLLHDVSDEVDRALAVGRATNAARTWVNAPAAELTPGAFAALLSEAAGEDETLECVVYDEEDLRRDGFGGILAVGQGSASPPCLIRLRYFSDQTHPTLALVGKGITFDSGGLSSKSAAAMESLPMKIDMSGAAAVVSAAMAIAKLRLPVNVTAWAPMAENMPSGKALRPSDVVELYGGRTVEVVNTDAEGRLILADVLARASEDAPDLIVDIATLTMAQKIALGPYTAAVMSNSSKARHDICAAADHAGEQAWPMPLPLELLETLTSEVADMSNKGGQDGAMIKAGLFMERFVDRARPWIHLDIAGPAFNSEAAYGYTPKGATGAGVRTLVRLAEKMTCPEHAGREAESA